MSAEVLEQGYRQSYQDFYRWNAIFKGASSKEDVNGKLRHIAYAGGWKKFEPMWDWIIRAKRVPNLLPVLEKVLAGSDRHEIPVETKRNSTTLTQTNYENRSVIRRQSV
jgi:hypothetical protein